MAAPLETKKAQITAYNQSTQKHEIVHPETEAEQVKGLTEAVLSALNGATLTNAPTVTADVPEGTEDNTLATAKHVKAVVDKAKEAIDGDLKNYYKKNEVDGLLSSIPKFTISVVEALPDHDQSATTVYLLKGKSEEDQNLYTEYLWVNQKWEILGEQTSNLTLNSPKFTGTPTAPTADKGTNTDQIATTSFVKTNLADYATKESPAFTGVPTAPTAAEETNTDQVATTKYVTTSVAKLKESVKTANQALETHKTDPHAHKNIIQTVRGTSTELPSDMADGGIVFKILD